jgi:acetolactate synthase-1/2/3 large subunit
MVEGPELDQPLSARTAAIAADNASHLAAALHDAGVTLMYGVPGGNNLRVIAAASSAGCRFILTHTETAAVIMAGVTAELTGRPCAAIATRGPGAASAVNGMAQALLDRQAVLLITDRIPDADRHRASHQRVDQARLLGTVAKASVVLGSRDGSAVARAALDAAADGMPGPVHIDYDESSESDVTFARGDRPGISPSDARSARRDALERVKKALAEARRPVIVTGVGLTAGHRRNAYTAALREFVADSTVPVLTTYKARGVVGDNSAAAAGVVTGGTAESALLRKADLIVGIGLDPVELLPTAWEYEAPVYLVNPWPTREVEYFGRHLAAEAAGDLETALSELKDHLHSGWPDDAARDYRGQALRRLKAATTSLTGAPTPQQVVTVASKLAPPGSIATVDSGAHMLVAAPLWAADEPGQLIISSGLATMGFALPAAIAAALSCPDRYVVCFTGDGGLSMALAELETLARLNLPVIVVVFNDATLSLIAIKQDDNAPTRAEVVRYAPSDFASVGAAFGLHSASVADVDTYSSQLEKAFSYSGPTIIDVTIDAASYPAILDASRGTGTKEDT